jgi:hypothetical protein
MVKDEKNDESFFIQVQFGDLKACCGKCYSMQEKRAGKIIGSRCAGMRRSKLISSALNLISLAYTDKKDFCRLNIYNVSYAVCGREVGAGGYNLQTV